MIRNILYLHTPVINCRDSKNTHTLIGAGTQIRVCLRPNPCYQKTCSECAYYVTYTTHPVVQIVFTRVFPDYNKCNMLYGVLMISYSTVGCPENAIEPDIGTFYARDQMLRFGLSRLF